MRRYIALLGVIFVVVLSGCTSGDGESASTGVGEANENNEASEDKLWDEIQESGEITVGTSGTLYPSSYYPEGSDELTGFEVEVQKEIAKRLGVDIHFETMAFDATLSALNSGRIDMAAMGLRGENKEKFAYTRPIKYSYATMI